MHRIPRKLVTVVFRRPIFVSIMLLVIAAIVGAWQLVPNATERKLIGNWTVHSLESDGSTSVTHNRFDESWQIMSRVSPDKPYVEEGFIWSADSDRFYIYRDRSFNERLADLARFRFGKQETAYIFEWISEDEMRLTGIVEHGLTTALDIRAYRGGTDADPEEAGR